MAREKEFEGVSEGDALKRASEALGLEVEHIDYTLLDEGAEGVFGLGARPARIRVALPTEEASIEPSVDGEAAPGEDEGHIESRLVGPAPEKAAKAHEVTAALLERMSLSAEIEVADEEEIIVVSIRDVEGRKEVEELFSRARPPLAPSLQFLINKIVNRFPEGRKHLLIRAPGYERARGVERTDEGFDPELVVLAKLLAERVSSQGKVIAVHPMLPGDRRAIHQTIMDLDGVRTLSAGEGLYRRMYVAPDKRGKRNGGRSRRGRRRSSDGESEVQD